jgi:hypothetical protein
VESTLLYQHANMRPPLVAYVLSVQPPKQVN